MKKPQVVAFLGSPRKGGNSEILLNEAIKAIEENGFPVKIFSLNDLDIKPCQNCEDCNDTGICSTSDDMDLIYEAVRNNDLFIMATPIFFSSVSAQVKAMIDRCQCLWCEKYLLHKPIEPNTVERKGLLIIVGGMKKGKGSECASETVKAFFRTINVQQNEVISLDKIDAKGEVLRHPKALKQVREAGKRLADSFAGN